MPQSVVKNLAKVHHKSVKEVEGLWKDAVKIAKEMGEEKNYAYITGILKNMLEGSSADTGKAINTFLIEKYINQVEPDFNKFLETMTSVSIPQEVRPEQPIKKDEEDEEKKKSTTTIYK